MNILGKDLAAAVERCRELERTLTAQQQPAAAAANNAVPFDLPPIKVAPAAAAAASGPQLPSAAPSSGNPFGGISSLLGDVMVRSTKTAATRRSTSAAAADGVAPPVTVAARSSASLSPVSPRKRVVAIKAVEADADAAAAASPPASPKRTRTVKAAVAADAEGTVPAAPKPRSPRKPKAAPASDTA